MANSRRAYSYIRFSREHQALGDSSRRQLESTRKYCERKGLILDESLGLEDRGVSAFRGANVESGALGRFMELVESRQIPRGSALVVEGLDRLSRQDPWNTISLLKQLKDGGIEIHLTMADVVLSPDEPDDGMKLMFAVITAIRAHDESKMKSRRLVAAFAAKRALASQGKELVSKSVPWWLVIRNGKIVTLPERTRVVRLAFKLTAAGQSSSQIARRFNSDSIPTWRPMAKQWSASRIRDLIRGMAAVGTLSQTSKTTKAGRSHPPLKDYYPAVVSEGLAAEARAALRANSRGAAGRTAAGKCPINIFRGLLRHKERWMRFQSHRNGQRDSKTGEKSYNGYYDVIDPDTAHTPFWGISARQLEPVIIQGLLELKPQDLLPSMKGSNQKRSPLLKRHAVELERRRENLLQAIEGGATSAVARLLEVEQKLEENRMELTKAEDQEAIQPSCKPENFGKIPWDPESNEVRTKTASAIRKLVSRIDVGSRREDLPLDENFRMKLKAKLFAQIWWKEIPKGHEPAAWFPDPIKKDKRRKPLHILLTFRNGAHRLITRHLSSDEKIETVRIEAGPQYKYLERRWRSKAAVSPQ